MIPQRTSPTFTRLTTRNFLREIPSNRGKIQFLLILLLSLTMFIIVILGLSQRGHISLYYPTRFQYCPCRCSNFVYQGKYYFLLGANLTALISHCDDNTTNVVGLKMTLLKKKNIFILDLCPSAKYIFL